MTHNCNLNEQAPQSQSLCGRKLTYPPEIDEQLVQWVKSEQVNGVILSPDMLRREALRLIQPYCYEFKASTGWLDKFLSRHKLSLQPTSRTDSNPVPSKDSPIPENCQESMAESVTSVAEESLASSSSPRLEQRQQDIDDMDDDDDDDDESNGIKKEDNCEQKPANPERLKAFNMFVRLFIDENLDRLVPISKQPKEKINAIIMSCQRQFPEFSERARKRIRTYLKSCRRSTRLREPTTKPSMQHIPSSQLTEVNNILAQACQNETVEVAKRQRLESVEAVPSTLPSKVVEAPQNRPATFKATEIQKAALSASRLQRGPESSAYPSFFASNMKAPLMKLSQSEVKSMRNLIDGYRQSASFLHRSADELERLLKQCEAYSDEPKDGEKIDEDDESKARMEKQDNEVELKIPASNNDSETMVDRTQKFIANSKCEGSLISNAMGVSTVPSTSSSDRTESNQKHEELSSNIDPKISIVQHAPELLSVRMCESSPHASTRYLSPVTLPLSTERVHSTVSYSATSPTQRESHLLKSNEKAGTLYQTHVHKHNEVGSSHYQETHKHNDVGGLNHYQTHPHKRNEIAVSQYPLHGSHKKILVHHTPLIQISNHPSQSTSPHLSSQQPQQSHSTPTLVSHVIPPQSNAHPSLIYSFRTNQSQNRTSCHQSKQTHLHPGTLHYSATHHQGAVSFENPQQVADSRPQVMQQRLSPRAMNYHTVLSPASSSHMQDISRHSHSHIQDVNHQTQLQDIGRQPHSEYQHGHNIYEAHQSR